MQHIEGGDRVIHFEEIFASIQGESVDVGIPTIFVRLYSCNLKCLYCDQPQLPCDRKRISIENLYNKVRSMKLKTVCITGGEPLLQPEIYVLVYDLVGEGYNVSIETNGSIEIEKDCYLRSYKYVMDVKCPSSGEHKMNRFSNLTNLLSKDEVKFVIADREDYDFAKKVLKDYPTKATKLFSPMFDYEKKQSIGVDLSNWLIEDNIPRSRLSLQVHKFIGVQ